MGPNYLQVRIIRVEKESTDVFKYKHSFDAHEAWKAVRLTVRRPRRQSNNDLAPIPKGHTQRPIDIKKYQDLMKIMHLIPPNLHPLYKSIPHLDE